MKASFYTRPLVLLMLLLGSHVSHAASDLASEDRAWIDNYLKRERALISGSRAVPANAIQLSEADRWLGRQVRVQLVDGRVRRGLVERVEPAQIRLRVIVNGGRFVYAIDRRQIHYLLAE